ncbi:nucleoside hydrolase [Lyngbya sp. CCY1209]|uniref:nucleoside hydrolase n=1 Tax=Lyngbya sp. CCY1209 TaxID=2886103 RepID=UPI002D20F879|nr:nucleoside hydrolase [Lyngbya sp. CCY1209]MEB3886574.1 nucleoside hydrolase [Lyngbya sp. CCY1209]
MISPVSPRKILLDTDPGGDDVFALLWLQSLIRQGFAELVAVATADGNVAAGRTFTTASQLLQLGGMENIPVGRGVLVENSGVGNAAHIHGDDGIGNLSATLPPPAHEWDAAPGSDRLIIECLERDPGAVTIVAIGPLTNLAAAERRRPGILKLAREIVIMGGAFNLGGNVTPHGEFNITYNPEAARTVFESRGDLVMISLDVTQHLILTRNVGDRIAEVNPNSAIVKFMLGLIDFMIQTCLKNRRTRGIPGFLVHDAATVAYLFYPELFKFYRARVTVETQGESTRGMTWFERTHTAKPDANTWVISDVDPEMFFAILIEDFKELVRSDSRE